MTNALEARSLIERLELLTETERAVVRAALTPEQRAALRYEWRVWARREQLPSEGRPWRYWLLGAGRGSGKTRAAAEWVRGLVERSEARRIAIVAPTADAARSVCVEGESGLLNVCPPWNRPHYEPTLSRLTWPNGAQAFLYSAEVPARLRGPQSDAAWCEEIAEWPGQTLRSPHHEAWSNLLLGLRLGLNPRVVVTGTPKPVPLFIYLARLPESELVVSRMRTWDNLSNVSPAYIKEIIAQFRGTRLERQELYGELLEDVEGALWKRDHFRYLAQGESVPAFVRITVGVDPVVTSTEDSDECGIVVVARGADTNAYVLADYSVRGSPDRWARQAIRAFWDCGADRIVAETNQGGELVERVLRTIEPSISYVGVRAKRGKITRAEPVAALYEQRRVLHVRTFPELEEQLCSYQPGSSSSPDRMDALVYAILDVMDVHLQPSYDELPTTLPFVDQDRTAHTADAERAYQARHLQTTWGPSQFRKQREAKRAERAREWQRLLVQVPKPRELPVVLGDRADE